jgi:methyl-accepting chemotaxis protein
VFEPNVLDGLDSLYAGSAGSDDKGVFRPWFPNGTLETKVIGNVEYYNFLKTTKRETFGEPFSRVVNGQTVNLLSPCFPIVIDGQFIGFTGNEILTDGLIKMISSTDNASGKLVTSKGNIVLSRNSEQIGKPVENGDIEFISRLQEGKLIEGFFNDNGTEVYKVYVPIQLGQGDKPWFYAVDVPRAEVYAMATSVTKQLVTLCSIGVVLIMLAGWFLIGFTLKDLTGITGIIRKLSLGHVDMDMGVNHNRSEIGQMKTELGKLIVSLKDTADFANYIGEGHLDAEYKLLSDDDVLGHSLLEMRQSLKNAETEQSARAKEEKQRNWGTSGLAKFAEILRQDNNNMEALTYNVISNLVKYLDANQGGIFIMNDADDEQEMFLDLKACYAFDRKKFEEKRIRAGEGLVGACFLERKSIYMTDVPDHYINITSGLGDANPKAILISPLKVNDEIYGVIELASFDRFEPYQLEFVEKVSESIAATISSVNVNIRTGKLLEKTKLQTGEMSNAEEELRQTMEEMQATQEEMRRREDELNETLAQRQEAQELGKQ